MSLSSTARTVSPGARPVRLATRKIWVSTAMVACAEGGVEHHIGGFAPDARQLLERFARMGHLARVLREQRAAGGDDVFGLAVVQADRFDVWRDSPNPQCEYCGRSIRHRGTGPRSPCSRSCRWLERTISRRSATRMGFGNATPCAAPDWPVAAAKKWRAALPRSRSVFHEAAEACAAMAAAFRASISRWRSRACRCKRRVCAA